MLPGSLLILDEAHHAAPSSGGRYGIETKFTRAIRDLSGRFEHRLFLSATPHNGHSNSFSTLLELLDPYRFTRGVQVRGKRELEDVMVRRLKEDIRQVQGGFPKRIVKRISIDGLPGNAPELELSRLLDEYRTVRDKRHRSTSKRAQAAAGLLVVGLQQRLLSSTERLHAASRCIATPCSVQWGKENEASAEAALTLTGKEAWRFTTSPDADDERSIWTDEELAADEDDRIAAITAASEAEAARDSEAEALWRHEQLLLDRMQEVAEETRHFPDAKTVGSSTGSASTCVRGCQRLASSETVNLRSGTTAAY